MRKNNTFGLRIFNTIMLNADNGANGGGEETSGQGSDIKTFDDVLANKEYQAEFDRRVSKALKTAQSNWQKDYESKLEAEKQEAKKLAEMNEAEKWAYEKKQLEEKLALKEQELLKKELMATAKNILVEKNIPLNLAELLDYSSDENCKKSIEIIEKSFGTALENAVNDRLRGNKAPSSGVAANNNASWEQLVKNADKMSAQEVAEAYQKLKL